MADFKKNMSTIQQDYERRSAGSQSQFDQMDRAIRGVDLTSDPVAGKNARYGAPAKLTGLMGSNRWWIRQRSPGWAITR